MKRRTSILMCALLASFFLLGFCPVTAQQGHTPTMQQPIGQPVGKSLPDSTYNPTQTEKMARWANAARQKQLVKDSAKLVELTREFKEHMASAGRTQPTELDIKLLTQIEKLAHTIRDEMAYAGNGPQTPPPTQLVW